MVEPELPPLSKRHQIRSARFMLDMWRDELNKELRDLERLKGNLTFCIDNIGRACKGYIEAQDTLDKLTNKRKL